MNTVLRNFWTQRKWVSSHSGKTMLNVWGFPAESMLNALLRVSEQGNYTTLEIDEESPTRWTATHYLSRQVFVVEMTDWPPMGPGECTHWHDQTLPIDRKREKPISGRKAMPEPSLLFAKPKQLNLL